MRRYLAPLLIGVLAGLLAVPSPALAHGTLATSTPAQGSTVSERIDAVSMSFTEKPAAFAHFTITAPTGVRVDAGWSHGEPAQLAKPVREYQLQDGEWKPLLYTTGYPVNVAVSHLPAPGTYKVTYHSVASDGDKVKGDFSFIYEGAVTPAPPGWKAPADQPKPELLAAEGHAQPSAAAPAPAPAPASAPVPAQARPEPVAQDDSSVWTWLVPVLLIVALGLCALLVVPQLRRRKS